eukprot:TRINITY_DN10262_c0_g1_i1.p1 TRINITY_DN10262_c0_g1~~TRINITY_DN10262_c0_g1_i1.p1  ORF type:complete len:649 (+),score=76.23 TRINITY_DN10262_c0_g1_i1:178-2124(+)
MPPWSPQYWGESWPGTTRTPSYASSIETMAKWESYALELAEPVRCSVVKVLLHVNGEVYFIDTKKTQHHYTFLRDNNMETMTLEDFNRTVYSGEDRHQICATIVKYGTYRDNSNAYPWTFEMVPTDPLEPETCERVALAFRKIQDAFKCAQLSFRTTSPSQRENLSKPNHPLASIKQADPFAIYDGKTYSCFVVGSACGTARVIEDANKLESMESLTSTDIVFFRKGIPNELPVVAAAIFAEPLPPLCHIVLLCKNRKTPCCFDTSAATEAAISQRAGKLATVDLSKLKIDVHQVVVNTSSKRQEPPRLVTPDRDLTSPIRFFATDDAASIPSVAQLGGKARACFVLNNKVGQTDFQKQTFAIPMGCYLKHISRRPVSEAITAVCNLFPSSRYQNSPPTIKSVRPHLDKIRHLIMEAKVCDDLVSAVENMIRESGVGEIILRSSTNAEDIQGFNAAGLYHSEVLKVSTMTSAALETAIKTVWASIWLPRGFLERLYFGLDSTQVGMCILVQPYFNNDSIGANGVAVTSNPIDKSKYGVYVTTFGGGFQRATDSISGVQPEQAMVHMSRVKGQYEYELLAPSRGPNIDSSKPVCNPQILEYLAYQCAVLHLAFLNVPISRGGDLALDIEWIWLENEYQLLILQARPTPV